MAQVQLGVASCASSNCHGAVTGKESTHVLQNEYVTWKRHDSHAKAWEVLNNQDSKTIAKHLGINNPANDKLCLSCHASSSQETGDKFRIEDGIGCESCHGAASSWIKKHTENDNTHDKNIENGMNELANPLARSNSCINCHTGSDQSEVNHRLIGAGHPRLTFELETFSEIMPRHWNYDKDYEERKIKHIPAASWLTGQYTRSIRFLELFLKSTEHDLMPDFTFFNCYSCHHSLKEDQWKKREYHGSPGKLNLNLSSLILVKLSLEVTAPNKAKSLDEAIQKLNNANSRTDQLTATKDLLQFLKQNLIESKELNDEKTKDILAKIKKYSANNPYPQYELAEQLLMAINVLSGESSNKLKAAYKALEDEKGFKAEKFGQAIRQIK